MDTIFAIMTEEKANQRETVKIGMDKAAEIFSQRHNAKADRGHHSSTSGA